MTHDSSSATQTAGNDSVELEALFDSIAAAGRTETPAPAPTNTEEDIVITRIGQLTRKVHESLSQLGYDRDLKNAAAAIPDTRERLAYVATMTEKAAERALNAIETAKPLQERLGHEAAGLAQEWERAFNGELTAGAFQALAERSRSYLASVVQHTQATNDQLREIMMAQDFQDLTGQMIKKITEMAREMETNMLKLLVEHCPPERREAAESKGLLNGPVINGEGRSDVVTSQEQVDDLLASLGF